MFTAPSTTNAQPTITETTSYSNGSPISYQATGNQITLPDGTYLISYGTTATSTSADQPSMSLAVNSSTESSTTRTGAGNTTTTLSGNYLLTASGGNTTLALELTPNANVTYNNNYMIVQKL